MLWDPAQTEKLVLLSDDDSLTIREVAEKLGVTHKAVVGKRHRLQLKGVIPKTKVSRWWDEHTEKLVQLCETTNMSASEIAERLGCTRNAVIGKVHRLQQRGILQAHVPPLKSNKGRKPRIRRKRAAVNEHARPVKQEKPKEVPLLQRSSKIACPCNVLELGDFNCRWIEGEPSAERPFCGALTRDGFIYCPAHCERAYHKRDT